MGSSVRISPLKSSEAQTGFRKRIIIIKKGYKMLGRSLSQGADPTKELKESSLKCLSG